MLQRRRTTRSASYTNNWRGLLKPIRAARSSRVPAASTSVLGGEKLLDRVFQLGVVDRLGHVGLGALAHAPHAIRLLVLRRDHDDRDMAGLGIFRDGARRLEPV